MSSEHQHRATDSPSETSVDKSVPVQKVEMGSESRTEHAAPSSDAPPPEPPAPKKELWWPSVRSVCRDGFSEFFGTMILVLFGNGVVAQVTLSNEEAGEYQSISWGWGLGVMLGFYCGSKSGGHLNPAVTLSNCIYRGFPWRKFPIYLVSQFLGGMAAAFILYGNYRLAIDEFEGGSGIRTVTGPNATAGIFCTYPTEFMDTTAMWWSEFISSALLQFVIYGMLDNGAGPLFPLGLFFLIFGIGACWGWQTGYAINLARDFGPRIVSYIVGYGPEVFTAGNYYFWIPVICPFFGCAFGGFLYDLFLYEGPSPLNTPYIGLQRLWHPKRSVWSNTYQATVASSAV